MLLSGLTNPYTQRSRQIVASDDDVVVVEMADVPPAQEEPGSVPHAVKCGPCKKNNRRCVGVPGRTCGECARLKMRCDKSLGRIGRRKDTKAGVQDTKGNAPGA